MKHVLENSNRKFGGRNEDPATKAKIKQPQDFTYEDIIKARLDCYIDTREPEKKESDD